MHILAAPLPPVQTNPALCLHCERLPLAEGSLCATCAARSGIRDLYRHRYNPEWEVHLLRLTCRAKLRLALFDRPAPLRVLLPHEASAPKPALPPPAALALMLALRARGYGPGVPSWLSPYSVATDRAACAELCCPECGRQGMEYHPYGGKRGEYRVIAACEACGAGEEF